MDRQFEILALADNNRITAKQAKILRTHYLRHGNKLVKRKSLSDPVSIILGGQALLSSLLPNLFGSQRATEQDFLTLFPGNGFWTVKFRNYLKSNIKYTKDIPRDMPLYTERFVKENLQSINPGGTYDEITLNKFYNLLRKESTGGGTQTLPSFGNIDYMQLLPIAAVVVVGLIAVSQSRRRKKRK